jgi:cytochrome c
MGKPYVTTLSLCVIAATALFAKANADELEAAGQVLFERECAGCHIASTSAHGVGPNLYGIVGRRVATAPNYDYSAALRTASFIWSEENLIKYINNPNAAIPCRPFRIKAMTMCPGIHMSFQGLHNTQASMAVVAYLKTLGLQQANPTE